jgi:hypothetical protein
VYFNPPKSRKGKMQLLCQALSISSCGMCYVLPHFRKLLGHGNVLRLGPGVLQEQKGLEVLPPPPKALKGKGADFLPRSFREMMRNKVRSSLEAGRWEGKAGSRRRERGI